MTSKKLLACKDKHLFFDMDGTITLEKGIPNFEKATISEHADFFRNAKPNKKVIKIINKLHKKNMITIYTTRIDYHDVVTSLWLAKHKVKYDNIIFNKPYYDYFIDDKNINVSDLK